MEMCSHPEKEFWGAADYAALSDLRFCTLCSADRSCSASCEQPRASQLGMRMWPRASLPPLMPQQPRGSTCSMHAWYV